MRSSAIRGSFMLATGAFFLAAGVSGPASADAVADFYRGKTIEIYNGLGAGGAYWTYARSLAQHLGDHVPGKPNVVVKTMSGGASRVLANWLYNVAPADGIVFGGLHERMGLEPHINPQGIRFDGQKFNWIGSIAKQNSVCITWHESPIKTIDDAKKREVIVASSGAATTASIMPRMLNVMLGTRFRIIQGYEVAETFLAMERGEVDGMCGYGWASLKTQKPDWIENNRLNMLLQFSSSPHPEIPHVQTMIDLVGEGRDRQVLNILFGTQEMGRPYTAPPGVPMERVTALRRAFDATMKDPEFLKTAARSMLEVDPITGEEIEALLAELYGYSKEVTDRVESFRKPMKQFEEERKK